MDEQQITSILDAAEARLAAGESPDLGRLGFWRAVAAIKRNPAWIDAYADRVGAIDGAAFRRWAGLVVPLGWGTVLLVIDTLVGLAMVGFAYRLEEPWNGLLMLAGMGLLLLTTHSLGHLVVGAAVGMRFSGWFLDGPAKVQPGIKTDYASYLRTSPRARAWMHASGAVVTKVLPFALLGAARAAQVPRWVDAVMIAVGVVQIATDALFSVKQSDWKKVRRELRVARDLVAPPG